MASLPSTPPSTRSLPHSTPFILPQTDLVRIDGSGNITLTSGGYHNSVTLASLNDALNLIGIRVTCPRWVGAVGGGCAARAAPICGGGGGLAL